MPLTNAISFRNLRGDLFGGVTAAIASLSLTLTLSIASSAGPVASLDDAV
ncbi:hypothetical protein [Komarekiella delphini-convector]|nr:hypothetical protein [Komarekiella delphini-convector]